MRFALALCGLATVALGCQRKSFPTPPSGILDSREAIQAGQQLYQRDCSICHGTSGHGDGPQSRTLNPSPADLRNLRGVRSEPGYWFFRIKEGGKAEPLGQDRSAMPAWGDHLSDREIWQIVAYLKAMFAGGT